MGTSPAVAFRTVDGRAVPAVTADQMREVDRVAVEDFGLDILQMMENAGRSLAQNAMGMLMGARQEGKPETRPEEGRDPLRIVVLAGPGGNGGGGLCCARHLLNRGFQVSVVLSRAAGELEGAAAHQLQTLRSADLEPEKRNRTGAAIRGAHLTVDALLGYSLRGAPRGRIAELIERCNEKDGRVLSLDVPSGLHATTGEAPGVVVRAERTLTLALPKTGLGNLPGELYLADLGIPPAVYGRLGLKSFIWPSRRRYWVPLRH